MNLKINQMAERLANKMTRTDCIYGMDAQDILCYFLDKIKKYAPKCKSTDLVGQQKYFSKVLKYARREILKISAANCRKLHMSDAAFANVRLLTFCQDWREADEARVKRTIARLSPESREIAEEYISAEWRHLRENEFLGERDPQTHVTLGELAETFRLSRSTFIRTRWNPMVDEFKKVWSLEN